MSKYACDVYIQDTKKTGHLPEVINTDIRITSTLAALYS